VFPRKSGGRNMLGIYLFCFKAVGFTWIVSLCDTPPLSLSLSQTPLFGRIKPSFSFGGLCHLFSALLHMWSPTFVCTQINTHRKEFPFKIQCAYFWWTPMELHQQWACNHSPSPFTHSLTQSARLGDHLSKDLTHFMLFVKSTLELFIERYQHLSLPTRS
jgi:hypothetical protein